MSHKMITITSTGNFKHAEGFFKRAKRRDFMKKLSYYGKLGVDALAQETPKDSGASSKSWGYTIEETKGSIKLYWTNDEISDGVPVVILIQYGHATRNGSYVEPRDFINPVTREIFDQIASSIWEEVTRP